MPQSRPSVAVRPQSGPGDELTASDIRAAWLPSWRFDPASSPATTPMLEPAWNWNQSPMFPSVQTAVIA